MGALDFDSKKRKKIKMMVILKKIVSLRSKNKCYGTDH